MDDLFASDHVDDFGGVEVEARSSAAPRFDPTRRAKSRPLQEATVALAKTLTAKARALGQRRRARTEDEERKFRLAVEALCANLMASFMRGHEGRLEVPRQHGTMSGCYASEVYGRHFTDILDLMAHPDVGLIQDEVKGFNVKGGPKQATVIRALAGLTDALPLHGACWSDLTQDAEHEEVLLLKGEKGRDGNAEMLPYAETKTTTALRNRVRRLNKALLEGDIEVVPNASGTWDADPTDRMVRRYFNNKSWQQGGRLFGGFWMPMPRQQRFAIIRLDGQHTVNVDYEQLFPCLAYSRALLEPPEGDLYDIDGKPEHRKGWKKVFNALLFARKPLTTWPQETAHLFPERPSFKIVRQLLCERHAPIQGLFERAVGYHFMHTESRMLLDALEGMRLKHITALPLHDAVLVGEDHGEAAKLAMENAVQRHAGITRAMVKIEKS
ncbi:hypothetical protein [Xanthobacter versatilis]|uniref:hypothetical protein n=1 Tax=Xanthobacter autotrophicus (strain ATCC BAA-1158 / Py2) TaxID=78245 RepID=UPI00372CB0A7